MILHAFSSNNFVWHIEKRSGKVNHIISANDYSPLWETAMVYSTKFDSATHHRRSIRLSGYDYAKPGGYFFTICTQNRACLFGDVVDGMIVLNDAGKMVEKYWKEIPQHFPNVILDEHIIMPNHFHGIIMIACDIEGNVGANNYLPLQRTIGASKTVGSIIRGFKIGVTKWFRHKSPDFVVWQRNYYERIIRNEKELFETQQYIMNNPVNWEMDENYRCRDK